MGPDAGETAVARKHTATTKQIAAACRRLGEGATYGEVSLELQAQVRGKTSDQGNKAWRRASDVVEVFAPVLWADWLSQPELQTPEQDPARPRVVMVDDMPIFGLKEDRKSSGQRFAVLGLMEYLPDPGDTYTRSPRLRLLRAFPRHDQVAYGLLLDELDYVPDFVIADGGKGIRPAVEALADRTRHSIAFVTSWHHLKLQLNGQLAKSKKAKPSLNIDDLAKDVRRSTPFLSPNNWVDWWVKYERRLTSQKVPEAGWPRVWKNTYYDRILKQMRDVAPYPDMPNSTGALETATNGAIKDGILRKANGLGNLIRAQSLLDLATLNANGYFTDMD